MTSKTSDRTTARHRDEERTWASITVVGICLLALLALTVVVWSIVANQEKPEINSSKIDAPRVAIPTTSSSSPADDPSGIPTSDLVANARKILPLEDIAKGDRVLYQGHLCYWREWEGNINVSQIECGEGNVFQVPTGRLTPVELRTGPSKLKIKHP